MHQPLLYFVGPEARAAFYTLLVLYFLSETVVLVRQRASVADQKEDRGSLRRIALVMPLAWWSAIALAFVRQASFGAAPVFHVGLALMIAGQLLRWWSIATLGRFFTVNVAIRTGHTLVSSGPYRYVRHPSYTAILLIHLGAALCYGNALSLLALMLPVIAVLLNRMRVEEGVLSAGLGEPYRAYMRSHKRLLPGIY